jgi:hypothetical protein
VIRASRSREYSHNELGGRFGDGRTSPSSSSEDSDPSVLMFSEPSSDPEGVGDLENADKRLGPRLRFAKLAVAVSIGKEMGSAVGEAGGLGDIVIPVSGTSTGAAAVSEQDARASAAKANQSESQTERKCKDSWTRWVNAKNGFTMLS